MASERRRISKVGLLALVVVTVLGATGLATVMSDVTDPVRESPESAALEIASVDPENDRIVVRHDGGDDLVAADHVVAVSVGDRTLYWNGTDARSDALTADGLVVVDLDTGRLWWGVDTDSRPTWSAPTTGGDDLALRSDDTVRVRILHDGGDLPVADLTEVA
jgi:hypothetical protein